MEREHRKFKRYSVNGVAGKILFTSDLTILNISIDGMAIETSHRLFLDQEYVLKLKYDGSSLSLKGTVMWSNLSHSKTTAKGEVVPVYRAGIRFRNVLTDESSGVLKFIESKRVDFLEKRIIGLRFRVSQPDGAEIDLPCSCSIEKISQSGMLIESETRFEVGEFHDMALYLNSRDISVRGRIANSVETEGGDIIRYRVGIEFTKMSETDMTALKQFLTEIDGGR